MNLEAMLLQIADMPLSEIEKVIEKLPAGARKELEKEVSKAAGNALWTPLPGPQTDAYFSKADVLLYGGSGGAGKSDLGVGLAMTQHSRSLILRRKYVNLGALTERALQINGSRAGFNGSPPPLLRTADGRYIQFAGCQHLGDEQDWQGQPFDLKVFDEATQFLEAQVRFHLGWIRTTDTRQRCRAVLPTNPPVDASGDWIIKFFRPWLDLTHPNPAEHGELRFFVTAPDGADLEVDGPDPVQLPGADEPAYPKSRTFIPGKLKDNPYLVDTGYQAQLDGLPEPLRSAVRDGNFMAARADDEWQVIPTQWIIEAQARWKPEGRGDMAMTACAIDVGAGRDETVLAARHGGWFAELRAMKGDAARDPAHAAQLAVKYRKDNCPVVVDVGGGFGGPAVMQFKENGIPHLAFNGANKSIAKSKDGKLSFVNKRAEAWWKFREELDPSQEGGSAIALPSDPQLRADLAAPTWKLTSRGVQIEAKEDVKDRIGRSPDRGDAVVMCMSEGGAAATRRILAQSMGGRRPQVIVNQRGG